MRKVYIYPPFGGVNLYKKYIIDSFTENKDYIVTNHDGIGKAWLNLYKNFDADMYLFSWPESLCVSMFGFMRFIYISFYIGLFRLFKKKIIWILHNKHPHNGDNWRTRFGMRLMARLSTIIVTHSKDGIQYLENVLKVNKGYYIPHPVYSTEIVPCKELEWDYIIWGTINSRKRILEFLEFIRERPYYKTKKILLCGRCPDLTYNNKIEKIVGNNVTYLNRFVSDDELRELISKCKSILFTYLNDSVLSSGALIYSLNFNKPIIGPNLGAFKDLDKIVSLYNDFDDIENIDLKTNEDYIKDYIENNQWKDFPTKIENILF